MIGTSDMKELKVYQLFQRLMENQRRYSLKNPWDYEIYPQRIRSNQLLDPFFE